MVQGAVCGLWNVDGHILKPVSVTSLMYVHVVPVYHNLYKVLYDVASDPRKMVSYGSIYI